MITLQKQWFLRWKCPECGAEVWESDEGDVSKRGGALDCNYGEEEDGSEGEVPQTDS